MARLITIIRRRNALSPTIGCSYTMNGETIEVLTNGWKRSFQIHLAVTRLNRARTLAKEFTDGVPQVDWISISGKIAVDCVLRMENLQEDFAELCCTLGLPSRELPCRNWRYHRHYSYYHNGSTRRLVEKYYAKDIETFGYRFDSPSGIFRWGVPERLGIRLRSVLSALAQAR
jgi:hypothetical protein